MAAIAHALSLAGCGGAGSGRHPGNSVIAGRRGPSIEPAVLSAGAELAHRFSGAYARAAYRRFPPALPGESAAVARALSAAADNVPPARRPLRPRPAGLRLSPLGASALRASAAITGRRNPPFSIGFVLRRRGSRWLITTVSPPD
jgi:hypothetical protein